MNNLQPLKWRKGAALDTFETVHELVHYTIRPDIDDPNKYRANLGNGDHKTLNSVDEAKQWIETDYYPHKMQPYVKPMPTWISVDDRLPETDILFKEFLVYDNLNNKVSHDYWNNEQREWNHYQNHVTHWMPLPEFSEVTK